MDWEMPLSLSEIIDMDWVREKTDEIYKYEVTTDNVVFKDEAVYLEKLLRDSGFEDVESYAIACDGVTTYDDCTMPEAWTRTGRSTLEVINENYTGERMIADTDKEPINLAIWSPPTPEGGICAELINFADGVSDDLHEFAGKIVLCDDSPVGDRMMKLAESGAVGLVSFVRKVADTDPDAVRWMNGVGHRGWYYIKEDKRIWNFSITARRGLELEARLKAGEKITLRAVVNTKVYDGETYTVTGRIPARASPAENVTACSSAIPASKSRSGNLSPKGASPVPSRIAAVTAQIFSFSSARAHISSPNAEENVSFLPVSPIPCSRENGETP